MSKMFHSLPLTEIGFVKIWTALTVEYEGNIIIDRITLEKELANFHGETNYSDVFNDIIFICDANNDISADLYHGFTLATIIEILEKINENEYKINIDMEKANEILSSYEEGTLIPMINLYENINSKKRKKN